MGSVFGVLLLIAIIDPTGSRDRQAAEDAASAALGTSLAVTPPATSAPPSTALAVGTPLQAPPQPAVIDNPGAATAALAQLGTLEVKGRAPKTGYDRNLFGPAWTDDVTVDGGHNGCDTRNDILRRDLTDLVLKPGSDGCAVDAGSLHDPYTATTIGFVRGQSTSSAVQIDHMVALSDAWQKGAQQLDPATRQNFANDPRNLQAADGPINQQKGDGDAATWLPPNKSYRCTYVSRQVDVKAAFRLWVTQAEHDAITRVLADCGATLPNPAPAAAPVPDPTTVQPAPPAPAPVAPAPAYTPQPVYTPDPVPAPRVELPPPPITSYANCSAVRAAGAAPIYAGQPGYSSKLDRDGDGVACEN